MTHERKNNQRPGAKGVLRNHIRVGTKIKSSFLSKVPFRETSYIDEIIPEIIHIAMFLDAYGYEDGVILCEKLFEVFGKYSDKSHLPFVSNLLSAENENIQIVNELAAAGILQNVRTANTPLCLIPGWPLSFLGHIDMDKSLALERLQQCVGRILDKSQTPACAALAMVMYWQGVCGKLHYTNGVTPPDLNAMISAPESEAAGMARASVRAFTMAYWGLNEEQGGVDGQWAATFWRECFRLAPCVVSEVDSDDD